MTELLEGRPLARTIRGEVAEEVERFVAAGGRPPCLAAVLVGDDPASQVYVRSKGRALARAGCTSRTLDLPVAATEEALVELLAGLNDDDAVDGILVQLPLPGHLDTESILESVSPAKDVDGFHAFNVGRLWRDRPLFAPATPMAVIELLRRREIQLAGRHAVIVGRSNVVGKPLAALLLRQQCTVTVCHSRTRDLAAECRRADLLVAAVGRPALIGPEHVKRDAVVIDVGINRISDPGRLAELLPHDESRRRQLESKGSVLIGDVDFARVAPLCSAITPVPGGIGPLTVAMLLINTLAAARRLQGIEALSWSRFLVGLTGGIAAGKSTVAGLLREAGLTVVDADRTVAELYQAGAAGAAAVTELFGDDLLAADGGVDHPRLAAAVFADPDARRRLEARIHPLVRREFARVAAAVPGVAVLEATLLVEAGYGPDFDLIVTVEADPEERLCRAMARGLDEAGARARLAAQGDGAERRAAADFEIHNDGGHDDLVRQVQALLRRIATRVARSEASQMGASLTEEPRDDG